MTCLNGLCIMCTFDIIVRGNNGILVFIMAALTNSDKQNEITSFSPTQADENVYQSLLTVLCIL